MPEAGAPEGRPAPFSPASRYASALLAEFVRGGVTDIVVAPGSRSQALALAAADLEAEGRVRLHVRIDERGAGFLALGLALESGRPAVVVTTSGTAVANLHPAVLEAHHTGVPLIALTADRPDELRRIRSNQTTVQPGIFGEAVRLDRDVAAPVGAPEEPERAAALARRVLAAAYGTDDLGVAISHPGPGPVHLNLQLREPLSGAVGDEADAAEPADRDRDAAASDRPAATLAAQPVDVPDGPRAGGASDRPDPVGNPIEPGPLTVVVAGAGAGERAETFAREGGWPLLAEVSSGARFGPNLVVAARELLREPGFGDRVERVVVFGHPTLTREVPELIRRDGVETIVVAPSGIEWFNPGHRVRRFERAVHAASHEPTAEDRSWLRRWVHASRALIDALDEPDPADSLESGVDETGHVTDFAAQRAYLKAQLDRMHAPVTRRMLVEAVWSATWPHDRLLFGASRLIRDADRTVPGRRIRVHANRGLSGIDGTVATAIGIAIASQQAVPRPGAGRDALGRTDGAGEPDAPPPAAAGITRAVIGDLTLLHDVGSLLLAPGEVRPRLQLIVGNDGGGTIFDALEVAGSAAPDRFDRVQYTPQTVDLAALAAAYGWEHRRAATRSELAEALGTAVTGPSLLEVPLAR
ncbi:2-succinyl-5-enolpyruvyl-6-hydroxy-3-cyclohexene-1-carboxylic-acid synthase [Agromyces larvae]|uniref:2-succinyl-5-enolpyruvyl-6-hydroxy-3-cyclohexene-1-carboxylate synthase n=1 Tax=Agromyces larvae TaxID=2929802 RepID=A0ABY4BX49_9MICO|nr:2-succinyl-5-enolpyruvyl-6-hydroxy-3-cyclohexene-1-carboxylic-acid synthase [Agromyces larvae]UOE43797.1 2-succinyl-5-enolpyruvyl-6-hydroxy-3-cyclohexene-1-carboxylic-acid synthase [Agromyces larvae]